MMTFVPVWLQAAGLLVLSNVFMTFAWYAHLRNLNDKPWWIAALASWGIALFEYALQVPGNRTGGARFPRCARLSAGHQEPAANPQ